ncbi:MAG: IPT/TIG domain-containing protein [Polyangiaceae bacterium]|nr:IPT/TIG domain-containing protein [Polyangiaceae bacterium]
MRNHLFIALALVAAMVLACSSNSTNQDATGSNGNASMKFALSGVDFTGNSVRVCGSRPAPDPKYRCNPSLTPDVEAGTDAGNACPCFNFNADGSLVDSHGAPALITGLCPSADFPAANWAFSYALFSAPDCGGTQLNDGTHNFTCYDSTDLATQAFPNQSADDVLNPGLNTNHVLCNTVNAPKQWSFGSCATATTAADTAAGDVRFDCGCTLVAGTCDCGTGGVTETDLEDGCAFDPVSCEIVCSSGGRCLPWMIDCNGECIDPKTSNTYCGASGDCQGANAGVTCISGQFCSNGMCVVNCPGNSIPCGTGSSAYCAYTQVDRVNCGACGTICNPGEVCQASACAKLALTSLSETIASVGDSIVLDGTGFSAVASNDAVAFGSVPATVTSATETELTVVVPGGLTGPVEVKVVRVDQGVASNTLTFYPWLQTAPAVVSGTRTDCTVFPSNTGRKIAAAANGFIYAGFMCGGQGYVASSYDAGATFSPALAIPGFTGMTELALQAGPCNHLYAAGFSGSNVVFSASADAGKTFSSAVTIASMHNNSVSLAALGSNVYVGYDTISQLTACGNTNYGVGAFICASVSTSVVFMDIFVDPANGDVWLVADDPNFHLARSTDGGLTFGPVINPTGATMYSDWTFTNSRFYVAGSGNTDSDLYALPASDPTAVESIPGVMSFQPWQGAISSDARGNVYIAAQDWMNGNAAVLQQYVFGAPAIPAGRSIEANTSSPGVVGGLGASAVVVYNDALGRVKVTIQTFP